MNGSEELSSHSENKTGGRRPESRQLQSDCPPEIEEKPSGLGHRSISLTTLQTPVTRPRMAQLETLEAKMASIEVSLSSTPRRKKSGSLGGVSLGSMRSIPRELAAKELENLRNALKDKENIIQSLKGQLTLPGFRLITIKNSTNNNNNNNVTSNIELTENEKKQAEERLNRLRVDVDNKKLAIKNLKLALEKLDITDNIDVRIQQAELEYQLGREELNLLTLLEESRTLQMCLEESNKKSSENTLYSYVNDGNEIVTLLALEVEFDPKSPKFGAGEKEGSNGLWIDWGLEETGLYKGDRLIEVNGKLVLTKNRDDLARLLAAAPDPAQLVVLRKVSSLESSKLAPNNDYNKEVAALRSELNMVRERAEEVQKAKDALRSDNIRLTHRISYLEEQVSDLLNRKSPPEDIRIVTSKRPVVSTVKSTQNVTNINITSAQNLSAIQNSRSHQNYHQNSPQLTTLQSNMNGLDKQNVDLNPIMRSKSSLSNVSNTLINGNQQQNMDYTNGCHKSHRHHNGQYKHRHKNPLQTSMSAQSLDQGNDALLKSPFRKHHHHHHREKDYNSETNSGMETRHNKRNSEKYTNGGDKSDILDQNYQRAAKIVQELTQNRNLYEKHRQKCLAASEKYNSDILKHYNARKSTSVLDFRSEIHIGPKYPTDSKSVEDLDALDHQHQQKGFNNLQNSRSVKSLDFDSDCNSMLSSGPNKYHKKTIDYTSEPIENNYKNGHHYFGDHLKPRPTPPKKPLRLSLHKTQSLQSVETPPPTPDKLDAERKSVKRNYKGEMPVINIKNDYCNGNGRQHDQPNPLKWRSYHQNNYKQVESDLENGSWC